MKRVCAWCGAFLGEVEPLEDPGPTHGICEACAARWEDPGQVVEDGLRELGELLRQYPP